MEGKRHRSSILNSESADGGRCTEVDNAPSSRWLIAGKQQCWTEKKRKEGKRGGNKATVSMQSPPCESAFRMHTCVPTLEPGWILLTVLAGGTLGLLHR